jgi:hypothetical protein
MSDNIGRTQRYHEAHAWYLVAVACYTGEPERLDYAFLAIDKALILAAPLLAGGNAGLYDIISDRHRVYGRMFRSALSEKRPVDAEDWLASGAMQDYAAFQHNLTIAPFTEPALTSSSPLSFVGGGK